MKSIIIEVKNINGLHARPAASFVKLTSRFKADIKVSKDGDAVDGKSILGLMLLAAEKGTVLKITAQGEDEELAIDSIKNLVEVDRFGEK